MNGFVIIIPRQIGRRVCQLLCRAPGVSVPARGRHAANGSHLAPAHKQQTDSLSSKIY